MKGKQFLIYSLLLFSFLFGCGKKDIEKEQLLEDIKEFQLYQGNAYDLSHLALKCITKEYPYKPGHVINSPEDIHIPRDMHPAFYGCFDWHSAVHGHWMLVKLLKMYPDISNAEQIRKSIDGNLQAENITKEVEYFQQQNRKSFERTYGWAWLLKLYTELKTWDDTQGKSWAENVSPLARLISRIPDNILIPATVADRSDPKIVHLDGLNISRAWCMFGIAAVLPENNAKRNILIKNGLTHFNSGLQNILSGNYEGEHWLASFAIYAYSVLMDLKENI